MIMKGRFRDVIKVEGEPIEDRGWRPNSINEDFGRFLAATLKKDITSWDFYIAVGNTTKKKEIGERTKRFKENIQHFFEKASGPYVDADGNWAWAKAISPDMVTYLQPDNNGPQDITNRLQINVKFKENEPDSNDRGLTEFSLLARVSTGEPSITGIYLINYATHGTISKTSIMTLDRTIILTFPLEKSTGKGSIELI